VKKFASGLSKEKKTHKEWIVDLDNTLNVLN
jgi:hypothetical protein